MKINSVLKKVEKEIVPGKEERKELEEICEEVLKVAAKKSKKLKGKVKPILCGSVQKDTWLKGTKDVDLFFLFDEEVEREKLEKEGLALAKEIAKELNASFEKAYAEHPYIRMNYKEHWVDLVPAYDVKTPEEIKSSVDRTPYHVRYIKNALNSNQKKEARFLKKFCKGIGVYGSDLKTRGFSGYLCELLIVKYERFENLLKASSKWFPGKVVDLENYYKSKAKLREKFHTPLITVDPVDKNRNVSSVLHEENFLKFVKQSKQFLRNPSKDFFFPEEKILKPRAVKNEIRERETTPVAISFKNPMVHQDVLYPQLRKFGRRIKDELEKREFKVLNSCVGEAEQTCYLILELEISKLPSVEKQEGPSIYDRKHSEEFLKHYRDKRLLVKNERWEVEKPREFTTPKKFLNHFLHKRLKEKGIPKHLAKEIEKNRRILSGEKFWKELESKKDLKALLYKLLKKSYG